MTEQATTIGHNRPPLGETLPETYAPLAAEIEALAARANEAPRRIESEKDLGVIGDLVKSARALVKKAEDARTVEKEPSLEEGRVVDRFFAGHKDRASRIQKTFQEVGDEYTARKAAEARQKALDEARRANEEAERQAALARKAEGANRLTSASSHDARSDLAAEKAYQAEAAAASSSADLVRTRTETGTLASARENWDFAIMDLQKVPLERIRMFLKPEHIEAAVRAFVKINKDTAPLEGVRVFKTTKAAFR